MAPKSSKTPSNATSKKKTRNTTKTGSQARTAKQRVLVMGPTGKLRLVWREWEN